MRTLYVTDAGSHIQKNAGRFLVCKGDTILREIPLELLDNVVLFGSIQVSAKTITEFLKRGITLTWLSKTGEFYGRLESTRHIDIFLHRQQIRMGDRPDFCLKIAQAIIDAKIANCMTILRRYQRTANSPEVADHIHAMGIIAEKIPNVDKIETLLGLEGSAARHYFTALACLVPDDFAFKGRNKQPPKDPFNSLLSFGYTLLMYDFYTIVQNAGLHPYAGFLHKDRQGHPTLVSDLMEEWRPSIIDSLVMSLIHRREIQPLDFLPPDKNGGVYLNREASAEFIAAYEKRMTRLNKYGGKELTFRQLLARQAKLLSQAIENEDPDIYQPIYIR
ncbi:CRISPR-associated protein Cas1 [Thermosinus carboxydivorans Nor1]|uniref:CRISPR-associated endonuclease Cas1 n=1 Tax=Thermosinus carboxydivorans Nor1 TaxID=401526 RepID=A1HM55_9FIRM|nr:CRISPR-associated endonuclease Cas1 [Thermosinus carboxydivorans]EAX48905.1 CRISPR-associated protein Cas1 [Thermosinus carboxydivorans Nor1]